MQSEVMALDTNAEAGLAPLAQPPAISSLEPAAALESLPSCVQRFQAEIAKVVVGQQTTVETALYALFSRGHCLLVGVPGLAKTLLVQAMARALELSFSRIQFTPDLMPSDITGTEILQEHAATGRREFCLRAGTGVHAGPVGR